VEKMVFLQKIQGISLPIVNGCHKKIAYPLEDYSKIPNGYAFSIVGRVLVITVVSF
jgi:hypothetical protein